jgi:hypothetical protein
VKRVYALLCVLGLVWPYYFFIPFVQANGLNIRLIISHLFANQIAAFFGADVIVSSLALWAFIFHEIRKRRIRLWWLSIIANLAVGVSLGLPLFLWLRENDAAGEKLE